MKLAVIIPTHNRSSLLKNLLSQMFLQKGNTFLEISVIIIDDGSRDGTREMLNVDFPDVHVIDGTGEWWYTKSMNEGFGYAIGFKPDYLLTLNDDVELHENYFAKVYDTIKSIPCESIVGSASFTISKPHKIVTSGNIWKFRPLGVSKPRIPMFNKIDPNELRGCFKSEILSGRGMLIPIHVLMKLNMFDEKFIQYHSDGDFCLRGNKLGIPVLISYDMRLFIHHELTSGSTSYIRKSMRSTLKSFSDPYSRNYLKSKVLFANRHYSRFFMPVTVIAFILLIILKSIFTKER
ncbi:glycosyltransferase family 2 protein [Bacteroidota bacterium]